MKSTARDIDREDTLYDILCISTVSAKASNEGVVVNRCPSSVSQIIPHTPTKQQKLCLHEAMDDP